MSEEKEIYDKEEIYDEQISPLMKEIIEICKENKIDFFANCILREDTDGNGPYQCTTAILQARNEYNNTLHDLNNVVKNGYVVQKPFCMAMTITSSK